MKKNSTEKGKLLYKVPYKIQVFENGIKPNAFSYATNDFITYDRLIAIYELDYRDVQDPFFKGGFLFHYTPREKDRGSRELVIDGKSGRRFTVNVPKDVFNEMIIIIRKQIGRKIDILYKPNRYLLIGGMSVNWKIIYKP